jgi:hypothetical protein
MSMSLVSTVTVGSGGAASIEFTGIGGTGKDLLVLVSGRASAAADLRDLELQFNNDTGSNYSVVGLGGSGSSISNIIFTDVSFQAGRLPAANATASTFGNNAIYIANYASSSAKSLSVDAVTENNATLAVQFIEAGRWSGTAAITSIKLFPESGNFAQHSTASLYIIS